MVAFSINSNSCITNTKTITMKKRITIWYGQSIKSGGKKLIQYTDEEFLTQRLAEAYLRRHIDDTTVKEYYFLTKYIFK